MRRWCDAMTMHIPVRLDMAQEAAALHHWQTLPQQRGDRAESGKYITPVTAIAGTGSNLPAHMAGQVANFRRHLQYPCVQPGDTVDLVALPSMGFW
ncbi:hypothetical protein D3C78_1410190 [compost metagenome]